MLYNDYRPESLDDVVGQHVSVNTIKAALSQKRLGHSLLISGLHGTGKTTLARIIASELGIHKDAIFEVDAASNNGVDFARALVAKARALPMVGKHKIYIIDEAHMFSVQAMNALLKVIEEPPKHCYFVLCTTEPEKIISTIRSRCLSLTLRAINTEDITARLEHICKQEEIVFDEEALRFIAINAKGSMRDALRDLEFCRHRCLIEDVESYLGLSAESYLDLLDRIVAKQVNETLTTLDSFMSRVEPTKFLLDFTQFLRDLFYAKADETLALLFYSNTTKERMKDTLKKLSIPFVFQMLTKIADIGKIPDMSNQAVRLNIEIEMTKLILHLKKKTK